MVPISIAGGGTAWRVQVKHGKKNMSELLSYRFQVDERHGERPWVTQFTRELTEPEAERLTMLLHSVAKGLDDGRISLDKTDKVCAWLLGINLEAYYRLSWNDRIAVVVALECWRVIYRTLAARNRMLRRKS